MRTQGYIFLIAVALCAAAPALGRNCDKIYDGPNNGNWQAGPNWIPPGEPNPSESACIPRDKSVQLYNPFGEVHGFCKSLSTERAFPMGQPGTVNIRQGGRLHITDTSSIDGRIAIEKGGQLLIEGDMTIWGGGGEIVGLPVGGGPNGRIVLVDHTLWLRSTFPIDPNFLLKVHGLLEIGCTSNDPCPAAMLTNDAIVVADDGVLRIGPLPTLDPLDSTAIGGPYGVWRAENDGQLRFTVPVLGTAPWELVDSAAAEIIFDESSTKLFGPMTIQQGTLRIRADVKTTGNLDFTSVGGSSPSIVLEFGSSVEFGN
ncbi:MAG: hypothetical protein ACE5E5_12820 [Phycisphaerae bacterium]